jgi:GrpB-like predicted nucleotidyltransferase (UPF0157 family)
VPPQRRVYLLPHDPEWAERAEQYGAEVAVILGPLLVRMEHIGSTSIPGIHAKPVIDLMPIVRSVEAVDTLQGAFEAAGFCWYGEYGLPGRRYLNRDDPETGERLTNVHIYAADNPEVERHIAFRDYLRAHPNSARDYEAVKLTCAANHPADISGYMDCKDAMCKQIESDAVAWYRGARDQPAERQYRDRGSNRRGLT